MVLGAGAGDHATCWGCAREDGGKEFTVTHMRTASLGFPALMNSASASSNLPYGDRRAAAHNKRQTAVMTAMSLEEVKVKSNGKGSHPYLILQVHSVSEMNLRGFVLEGQPREFKSKFK